MVKEDDTIIKMIGKRLEAVSAEKASREYVEEAIDNMKSEIERIDHPHVCTQESLIEVLQDQIKDAAESIKKLYTWQATVGISLLVFFLTVGVAALRFVDKIDFAVQDHSGRIDKIEKKSSDPSMTDEKIRKIIQDAIDAYLQNNPN